MFMYDMKKKRMVVSEVGITKLELLIKFKMKILENMI